MIALLYVTCTLKIHLSTVIFKEEGSGGLRIHSVIVSSSAYASYGGYMIQFFKNVGPKEVPYSNTSGTINSMTTAYYCTNSLPKAA